MKRLIRWLYWKYAHAGDPWQSRLIVWHLSNIIKAVPNQTAGDLVIAQLNAINGKLEKVAEVTFQAGVPQHDFEDAMAHLGSVLKRREGL